MTTNKISFKGIPAAKYPIISKQTGKPLNQYIHIYEIEGRDEVFLKKMLRSAKNKKLISKNIQKTCVYKDNKEYIRFCYSLINDSINAMLNLFKITQQSKIIDPSIKYLATIDNKPCGIIMGNIPKISQDYREVVFSNRDKKNETELDWLVTWSTKGQEGKRGVGRALMAEYLNACTKLKDTDSIYVRSTIPMIANAVEFYKANGFKELVPRRIPYQESSRPRNISDLISGKEFKDDDYPVRPLELDMEDAKAVFQKTQEELKRDSLDKTSIDLTKIIKLN